MGCHFASVHKAIFLWPQACTQAEQTEQAKEMSKVLQQNYLRMKASSEKHIGRLSRQVEVCIFESLDQLLICKHEI